MNWLKKNLTHKGYTRIKLKTTNTNHFALNAKLNGKKGFFILDTGASNTCVGTDKAERFKLSSKKSKVKAAGAGALGMETRISKKNTVKIGKWKLKKQPLVLFDLSHVNQALSDHDAKPVDGIIGADILKQGAAIIDYGNSILYLK